MTEVMSIEGKVCCILFLRRKDCTRSGFKQGFRSSLPSRVVRILRREPMLEMVEKRTKGQDMCERPKNNDFEKCGDVM